MGNYAALWLFTEINTISEYMNTYVHFILWAESTDTQLTELMHYFLCSSCLGHYSLVQVGVPTATGYSILQWALSGGIGSIHLQHQHNYMLLTIYTWWNLMDAIIQLIYCANVYWKVVLGAQMLTHGSSHWHMTKNLHFSHHIPNNTAKYPCHALAGKKL